MLAAAIDVPFRRLRSRHARALAALWHRLQHAKHADLKVHWLAELCMHCNKELCCHKAVLLLAARLWAGAS